MTDINYMLPGLPGDIDADVENINSGAEDLDGLHRSLTGQTEETDARVRSAAAEFTDLIAWGIGAAAADELMLWEETTRTLVCGSSVLKLWAQDIEEYRRQRASIIRRYDQARKEAVADESFEVLEGLLLEEHQRYWEILMERAEDTTKTLRNGPTAEVWQRFVSAGLMTGREVDMFEGSISPTVEELPGEDWTAEQVASWWNDLAPNQQGYTMEEHPDELRNLNGVPIDVRDELNRAHLKEEVDHLSSPGVVSNPFELANMEAILESVEGDDDKFLIFYDPSAPGGGQAAISTGNPDLADNVSTMVPGMFNNMGTLETPIERTEEIYSHMNESDPNGDHASVVWMGYNTPPFGDWDSTGGATGLAAFQEGLRATHQGPEPSHNSVLGHSYGAYIAGAAANPEIGGGLDADSLVFIGGPGASVDHISELTVDEENVHVVQGDDDWIEKARERFGFVIEGFGTPLHEDQFYTDPENPGDSLGNRLDPEEETKHSGYFTDQETLEYLGEVLTGGSRR